MIKKQSLQIGSVSINSPVILAPMSGVTDFPFRETVRRFGAELRVTEMIASREMVRNLSATKKMQCLEDEPPLSVQLAGTDPQIMAEAAKMNEDRGADIIDINMGCPVKKVVKSYAGSALMRDEDLACRIMEAVVKAVRVPVTVKMRLGWDDHNLNAAELAKKAQDIGLSMVTVHGRTRTQMYKGVANWEAIATVKKNLDIPLIGNGDITCFEDIDTIFEKADVDGIMIGRAIYGRPWLISQAIEYVRTGKILPDPDLETQWQTVRDHYERMLEYYGVHVGLRQARKHLSWYANGLFGATHYRERIMKLSDPHAVIDEINRFYLENIEKKAA